MPPLITVSICVFGSGQEVSDATFSLYELNNVSVSQTLSWTVSDCVLHERAWFIDSIWSCIRRYELYRIRFAGLTDSKLHNSALIPPLEELLV